MRSRVQSLLLATILFLIVAFAPILVSMYAYYKIGISGCVLPHSEPKPIVNCSITLPPREASLTEQEAYLTSLLDYGIFALVTLPLAGFLAILTGVLCVYCAVKECSRSRKKG